MVGSSSEAAPIEGRAADAIQAARTAFEAALRLIRPGKRVADVAEKLAAVVEPFGCQLVEGVMSHQMKQFVIDGNKVVLNRPSPEHRVDDGEFEANEVYAIDIVVSTGEQVAIGMWGMTQASSSGSPAGTAQWVITGSVAGRSIVLQ